MHGLRDADVDAHQLIDLRLRVLDGGLLALGPVSYTHLDVYKRQVKDLACLDTYYGFAVFNSLEAIRCWTLVSFVIPVVAT